MPNGSHNIFIVRIYLLDQCRTAIRILFILHSGSKCVPSGQWNEHHCTSETDEFCVRRDKRQVMHTHAVRFSGEKRVATSDDANKNLH